VQFPPTRERVIFLGRRVTVTVFSDLTGEEVAEDKVARLVVKGHPAISSPVYLEVLPEEVTDLDKRNVQVVTLELQLPGQDEPQSFTLPVEDFAALAPKGNMPDLLANAPAAKGSRRSSGEEINYATAEHAGRPHRGKVSDEEAAYVREHLAEVNERLRSEGKRLIDPTNPEHKETYHF
jgi:hypothetical protein